MIKSRVEDSPYFWKKQWHHPLRPDVLDADAVMFIFVVDNWNFCFWPDPWATDFGINYNGKLIKRSWVILFFQQFLESKVYGIFLNVIKNLWTIQVILTWINSYLVAYH